MSTRKDYRVKLNLSYIFQDHRKYCFSFIKSSYDLVTDLMVHIESTYGIKNFYLMIEKKKYFYLSPQEDVRIIQPNNTIIVIPNSTIDESIPDIKMTYTLAEEPTEPLGKILKKKRKCNGNALNKSDDSLDTLPKKNSKKEIKENLEQQHIVDCVMNDIDTADDIQISTIETNDNNVEFLLPMDVEGNRHDLELNNNSIVKEVPSLTGNPEVHIDSNASDINDTQAVALNDDSGITNDVSNTENFVLNNESIKQNNSKSNELVNNIDRGDNSIPLKSSDSTNIYEEKRKKRKRHRTRLKKKVQNVVSKIPIAIKMPPTKLFESKPLIHKFFDDNDVIELSDTSSGFNTQNVISSDKNLDNATKERESMVVTMIENRNASINITENIQNNDNCTSTSAEILVFQGKVILPETIGQFHLMTNVTPRKNDFIIFQILKLEMDVSKHIIGKVIDYYEDTQEVELYISVGSQEFMQPEGRLTLNENQNVIQKLLWTDLITPRLLTP